ncbi:uncharacterized protein LOC116340976 isoform X2 [Contarinia nasturtii]|uniref:uncharacterized protein LOC116340976 isoform X2 n=1 Tax=Contarinia nasturtii TaxID=265458 RepID=UPI0012D3A6DC|nr:uncharacterized protein LOC116340976 isoform X2 [Contarinia nasturtii]
MPSRLIQGLDNLDTCSQFSDSATLHTLTRMGALQKEVYFSRSESNFNNFDTISYGNSSTCCCDAEIKMDLQLRNSIYQCNPRCSIEKRNIKSHSTAATAAAPTATSMPKRTARPTTDYSTSLLDKFERDRGDKHELHRNNYLNETSNYRIQTNPFNPFRTVDTYKYSTVRKSQKRQKKTKARADPDLDMIESIPLPPSVLNRRSASFRHNDSNMGTKARSANVGNHLQASSTTKLQTNRGNGGGGVVACDATRFKLTDILNNQKNKITSIDMHQYPALNNLNATLKRICRSNAAPSLDPKDSSFDHQKRMPFESFSIDAETYRELVLKNQPIPIDVSELQRNPIVRPSMSNLTNSTLADIQSVHASTCNLVTALRASSQSIVAGNENGCNGGGSSRFGRHCNSSSAMNLKYDSLRSHKAARSKRSNSEQLNSSYYHFQNIDGEMDNNSTTFDSVLLPNHSSENYKLPWKHRSQCPSIGSSSSSNSSNISKWDISKHWMAIASILLILGAASVAVPLALRVSSGASYEERLQAAYTLLENVPLIDAHNDLPYNIRKFVHNQLSEFNFDADLKNVPPWSSSNWSHTDLQRMKEGRVSAQFYGAYVPCEAQYKDAVQLTLEQIDVIIRLTDKYSKDLIICTSAEDIQNAFKDNKICSLIGVEGGHSISGSLAVLRMFYMLGVRYMTLTSTCHTPWADSSFADAPKFDVRHNGLTDFGKRVIKEMNRLGMIVDLSHVSMATMRDAIAVSQAPVIFSHSSAYEMCNSSRNVQDSVLKSLVKNRGIIMLNFYSMFLSCGQNATINHAIAHLNHIKRVAGADYIGIGAGYDGINYTPIGLEDVSKYPNLFAELIGFGWTVEELTKLAGGNLLRVFKEVETYRDKMHKEKIPPNEDIFANRLENPHKCQSN